MSADRTRVLVESVTSVGSHQFGIRHPAGRPFSMQLDVVSANITLQGTNAFSFDNGVGKLWTNITSAENLTTSDLWFMDPVFAGYNLVINSVAGHVTAIFAE